ncbi:hypothetical protein VTJ49DRAFT_7635 [Mycothermus thermophilus]|uniref:F-box domain-containing protein n=1 Tax=Humicola insolens TaxID=85995 RepID=A0ABR3VG99_HUMIN
MEDLANIMEQPPNTLVGPILEAHIARDPRSDFQAELARERDRNAELEQENRRLTAENRTLRERVRAFEDKQARIGKFHERTWLEKLRDYDRNYHANPAKYAEIYKLCCMEENMSTKSNVVHPGIKLVAPRNWPHPDWEDLNPGLARRGSPAPAPESDTPFLSWLPDKVLEAILKCLLYKPDELIHCLSRLDPFQQPDVIPSDEELGENRSGLPKRFFWGRRDCSITKDGADPQKLLAILGVNRRLYFLGVHIFYGLNTFAFSSLGEFGRFCTGIGLARLARIQHIELLWTGNQRLTCPPDERRKTPASRRTYPLSWLCEMPCLRTLVVHVNETAKNYVRRRYQNPTVKSQLDAKSSGQPNQRMTRSLRCLQGLDYVWQLRGLDMVKFYDFNQVLKTPGHPDIRHPVADWSFTEGVQRMVTMDKTANRKERCELERLEESDDTHLLRRDIDQSWTQGPQDWQIVKPIFEWGGSKSYDERRRERVKREEELAEYFSVLDGLGSDGDTEPDNVDHSDGNETDVSSGYSSDGSDDSRQWASRPRSVGLRDELFVSDEPDSEDEDLEAEGSDIEDSNLGGSDPEGSNDDAVSVEDSDSEGLEGDDSDLETTDEEGSTSDDEDDDSNTSSSGLSDDGIDDNVSESEDGSPSDTSSFISSRSSSFASSNASQEASPHGLAALKRENSSATPSKPDPQSRSNSVFATPGPRFGSEPSARPSHPTVDSLRNTPAASHTRTGYKREGSPTPLISPKRFRGDSLFVTPGPARTPAPGPTPPATAPSFFNLTHLPSQARLPTQTTTTPPQTDQTRTRFRSVPAFLSKPTPSTPTPPNRIAITPMFPTAESSSPRPTPLLNGNSIVNSNTQPNSSSSRTVSGTLGLGSGLRFRSLLASNNNTRSGSAPAGSSGFGFGLALGRGFGWRVGSVASSGAGGSVEEAIVIESDDEEVGRSDVDEDAEGQGGDEGDGDDESGDENEDEGEDGDEDGMDLGLDGVPEVNLMMDSDDDDGADDEMGVDDVDDEGLGDGEEQDLSDKEIL